MNEIYVPFLPEPKVRISAEQRYERRRLTFSRPVPVSKPGSVPVSLSRSSALHGPEVDMNKYALVCEQSNEIDGLGALSIEGRLDREPQRRRSRLIATHPSARA